MKIEWNGMECIYLRPSIRLTFLLYPHSSSSITFLVFILVTQPLSRRSILSTISSPTGLVVAVAVAVSVSMVVVVGGGGRGVGIRVIFGVYGFAALLLFEESFAVTSLALEGMGVFFWCLLVGGLFG